VYAAERFYDRELHEEELTGMLEIRIEQGGSREAKKIAQHMGRKLSTKEYDRLVKSMLVNAFAAEIRPGREYERREWLEGVARYAAKNASLSTRKFVLSKLIDEAVGSWEWTSTFRRDEIGHRFETIKLRELYGRGLSKEALEKLLDGMIAIGHINECQRLVEKLGRSLTVREYGRIALNQLKELPDFKHLFYLEALMQSSDAVKQKAWEIAIHKAIYDVLTLLTADTWRDTRGYCQWYNYSVKPFKETLTTEESARLVDKVMQHRGEWKDNWRDVPKFGRLPGVTKNDKVRIVQRLIQEKDITGASTFCNEELGMTLREVKQMVESGAILT